MANGFRFVISAVDNATQTVNRINRSLDASTKPFKDLGQSIGRFGQASGLKQVAGGLMAVKNNALEAVTAVTRLAAPLAAIGGAASIAGIGAMAERFGDFGTQLGVTAQRAQVTTQRLQQLRDAAQLGGGDPAAMGQALTSLHDAATGARNGTNIQAIQAFRTLGMFNPATLNQSTDQLFEQVRQKIATLWRVNPAYAEQEGSALLGGGYSGLVPALRRPDAQWRGYEQAAAQADPGLSDQDLQNADKLRESYAELRVSIRGLGNEIGAALAPEMTDLVNTFSTLIQDNREEIGASVRSFGEWLKTVNWKAVGNDLVHIGTEVNNVVKFFGGWKTVVEGIIGLKLAGWAIAAIKPLIPLIRLLSLIPGSGIAAEAAAIGLGGYLGFKGAVANGEQIADAAGLGLQLNSADEYGNALSYTDANGRVVPALDVPDLLRPTVTGPVAAHALSKGQQTANAKTVADEFLKAGYSREDAAAFIGNGIQESGLDPSRVNKFGFSGMFQWDAERQQAILQHFGKPVTAMTPQESAQAAIWELQNLPRFAGLNRFLLGNHDLNMGNDRVTKVFEAPRHYDVEVPQRLALSEGALSVVPDGAPAPAAPAPAAAPDVAPAPAVPAAPLPAAAGPSSGPSGDATIRVSLAPGLTGTTVSHGDNFTVQPLPSAMPLQPR